MCENDPLGWEIYKPCGDMGGGGLFLILVAVSFVSCIDNNSNDTAELVYNINTPLQRYVMLCIQ